MYNPALREQPRHRPAAVIPLNQESSILAWLEQTGRMVPRDTQDDKFSNDEEEVVDLIGSEGILDDFSDDLSDDLSDDDDLELE